MKTLIILIFSLFTVTIFAQKQTVWHGGTPGRPNDWNCAKNWSANAIPDEFSNVYIPDVSTTTFAYPILQTNKVEINQLQIDRNAKLTVGKNSILIVNNECVGINHENLIVNGLFYAKSITKNNISESRGKSAGND